MYMYCEIYMLPMYEWFLTYYRLPTVTGILPSELFRFRMSIFFRPFLLPASPFLFPSGVTNMETETVERFFDHFRPFSALRSTLVLSLKPGMTSRMLTQQELSQRQIRSQSAEKNLRGSTRAKKYF